MVNGTTSRWSLTTQGRDQRPQFHPTIAGDTRLDGLTFLLDLRERLANPIQLTTFGGLPYRGIVERAFGSDVDYAPLIKEYGVEKSQDASPTARRHPRTRSKVENHAAMVSLHFMHYLGRTRRLASKRLPLWRLAWPITYGPFRRSRRCSTRLGAWANWSSGLSTHGCKMA